LLPQFIKELIGVKLSTRTIFAALKPQSIVLHSLVYNHLLKRIMTRYIGHEIYRHLKIN
jgi:hypothetical protein